ncbi:hypothetical protein CLOTH_14520 [Alkalithermobacter paradoxus]|uniref:DUF4129 domain-containing protein n=1 Tax=Alkalithermobacter paradoxus TaxID=29349 RepID=A0A1V4I671_9FIRM|nr:hypothetical protein CLOTH_14520 [[Clostridium] thermoalcaliphilum]
MKSDKFTRALSIINQTLIYYIIFIFINVFLNMNLERVGIIYFFIVAFVSIWTLKINNKNKYINPLIGLMLSAFISFFFVEASLTQRTVLSFILYILWFLSVKSFYTEIDHIYSITKLNAHTVALIIINIFINMFGKGNVYNLNYISMLYIVSGLILLSILKHRKYKTNKNNQIIDALFVSTVIILSFYSRSALSQGLKSIYNLFVGIFRIILGYLKYLFMDAIIYISEKIFFFLEFRADIQRSEPQEIYNSENIIIYEKSQMGTLILNIIIIVVLIILALVIFYYIMKFIQNIYKDEEVEFVESRELCFDIENIKEKVNSNINSVKDNLKHKLNKIFIPITASTKEKSRYEYSKIIKILSKKELLKDNYTTKKIEETLNMLVPDNMNDIKWITNLYEEIRYGTKNPDNDEYEKLKEKTKIILKNLTNI